MWHIWVPFPWVSAAFRASSGLCLQYWSVYCHSRLFCSIWLRAFLPSSRHKKLRPSEGNINKVIMSKGGRVKDLWNTKTTNSFLLKQKIGVLVSVFCHRCRNASTPPSKLKFIVMWPHVCYRVTATGMLMFCHWLTCLIQSFTTRKVMFVKNKANAVGFMVILP